MRQAQTLRQLASGMKVSAGVALAFTALRADEAEAQEALPTIDIGASPTQTIDASSASANTLRSSTGIDRLPGPVQSIPQSITVIPQTVIHEQQATTVNQILQYVPGVTVATGEGGGGITGDQFRIRGFDASGDVYVDGLRDFGSYIRDSFATESIAVLKGPSSQSFGNGTTGGAIALESKKAHLGDDYSFEATGGSGPYGRAVLDVNRQIDETTAARIVAMGNKQDIVDRDHVYSNRWGVLGSLGFGLGSEHSVIVNYFHQHSSARPDFGVPIVTDRTAVGEPVTEYGVPRSNFFGRQSDHDVMNADVASILYKGEFGNWLTITNNARFGNYTRNLKMTPVKCSQGNFPITAASTCAADVLAGNLYTAYEIWPFGGTKQTSYGGENVTTAILRFDTGGFRHQLIAGVDVYVQRASTDFYAPSGPEPAGTLLTPIYQNAPGFSVVVSAGRGAATRSFDVGPFISDRIWITPQISVLGGVRWDHYHVQGVTAGTPVRTTTEFASPKASLIWEPTSQQTYYFSFARSFTPPGNNITSLSSSLGLSQFGTLANLQPESDDTLEIGGKWSLLDDRLGATAALFRVDKDNASYTDPTSGIKSTTDDKVRVQGIEAGLTGNVTDAWNVQASYTYLDGKIRSSSINAFNPAPTDGNRMPYVSRHGASLWTSYDVAPLIRGLPEARNFPGRLLVGGGLNYRSDYYVDNANRLRIPAVTTVDAMISYDFDRLHFAVNVTNLTNQLAYSSAFGSGYATPVSGRAVTATAGIKF